jgi:DNA-binding MarR family transcriptional regulator
MTTVAQSVDELVPALLRASRALVGVAAQSLAQLPEDVSLGQFRALVLLAEHGTMTVGALATHLGSHPSTATRLLDRLVAKKMVIRRPSEADRREMNITLAAAGRRTVDRVSSMRTTELARIAAEIAPVRRRTVLDGMALFADAAGELAAESWALGWPADAATERRWSAGQAVPAGATGRESRRNSSRGIDRTTAALAARAVAVRGRPNAGASSPK